ncbi:MAG: leucine--tRNA ligase [Bacteroidetes bacterium]|nr:leucine--tRNA ligase [Bacteroidota bacterium]
MEYRFREIEQKWQQQWHQTHAYRVSNDSDRPKYYVLDMFPYPSGSGLHVGHPLGYIASDIYSRYKRLKGFNVLHPMGYDAFGLPAEQYALEHGIHPAESTKTNIAHFRKQLDNIGFCFDWEREVKTSDSQYYKWTQWIFLQLFHSFFNRQTQKAEPISSLINVFEQEGNQQHTMPGQSFSPKHFTAEEWKGFNEKTQQDILMQYRLAFCGYGEVNWCEALGTVLANDEVVNGVSERGGHPVVKKKLRQWYLRITEYADRLLEGLERVDFSDSMKEMQTNWIGKSVGAEVDFAVKGSAHKIKVYTTRPDTIFGVDFLVIAPEHELVDIIKTADQQKAVEDYVAYVKSRSERERMAEKQISGVFTGAYVIHPFSQQEIPVWISEYVLAGYGTGAIMAVPCGDERDFKFAKHFNLSVTNIIGDAFNGENANPTKEAKLQLSQFLDGMVMRDAMGVAVQKLEAAGVGVRKINFKMRDASFSRQRYWGEPFPIQWKDGIAYPLDETQLPLLLPAVDHYEPGPEGEGPLANLKEWIYETNTMPGYAGSSWYFLRYMDPQNNQSFCDRKASDYWGQVDLYVGGTEHAVGHLLYSRMWTKVLYDLGHIGFDEPFKKLLNQGMIQGSSRFVYRINGTNTFVSKGYLDAADLYEGKKTDKLHVDVNFVDGYRLDVEKFRQWRNGEFANAAFILEEGNYICGSEVEKMSKSKFNTVNPDDIVEQYGADTFRMYEMFLGPVELSKPWDTKGIEGVHRFLKKLWRLFYDEVKGKVWVEAEPVEAEWKVLHKTIKKIDEDTQRFSFNTAVSSLMIAVNELSDLKCHKKTILESLLILLTPYAPHVSEELWQLLGHEDSILNAPYPMFEERYLIETNKLYPIAVNGKTRSECLISLEATQEEVEKMVLADAAIVKWLEGKSPKKIIYVRNKMINVVV